MTEDELASLIGPATTEKLQEAIFQAIGTASMCWEPRPEGIFRSDEAGALGRDLCGAVVEILGAGNAHLGMATTRELLAELSARSDLEYKTWGHD